jgi:hypothetical protein
MLYVGPSIVEQPASAWSHIPEDLSVNPPNAKLLFCDCVKNVSGYFLNLQHCGEKKYLFEFVVYLFEIFT